MSKLAILFTGQGAQYQAMGLPDLTDNPDGKALCDIFSEQLHFDVHEALLNRENELDQTVYAQPLILLLEIFLYEQLIKHGYQADGFSGFSLGEITALYASGLITQHDIIQLIKYRSLWMQEVATQSKGAMAAVIGLSADRIIEICKEVSTDDAFVMPVNFNTPDQTVISGASHLFEAVTERLKSAGAKRVLPLAVAGAFHTPYMTPVESKLKTLLDDIELHPTEQSVYLNTTARPHDISTLKEKIAQQVASPVYFHQSITHMIEDGFTHFLEIGPKPVLSSMVKKIDGEISVKSITSIEDIENLKGWL